MSGAIGKKKVYVATFGCQMNEYDSEQLVRILSGHGYAATDRAEEADLIFLNTCSIREKAEQKVYSLLGRLRPLKEDNPDLILAVGGCVAQQKGESMFEQAPYLDLVVGTHGLRHVPGLLDTVYETGRRVCHTRFDYHVSPFPEPTVEAVREPEVKAFLTVMRGCDNFCAYCVVPYVRGREISRPTEDILQEARALLNRGVKEITLLGQNVNSYGRGLTPEVDFTSLVRRVAELPGLERLRFTTSHPKDLSPELIRAFVEVGPLCEHIHLPVQAGSDRVLAAMRRRYTRADYLDKVNRLRDACPDISLTTDMIVGFPGETEEDFQQTMDLIRRVGYDGMYSFKYSDRPGTRASDMADKVEETDKGRRLSELQAAQKEISSQCNRALIGRELEVLVEGRGSRYPDQLTGRTRGNKIVNFRGPAALIGELTRVLIEDAWANSLLGAPAAEVNKPKVQDNGPSNSPGRPGGSF